MSFILALLGSMSFLAAYGQTSSPGELSLDGCTVTATLQDFETRPVTYTRSLRVNETVDLDDPVLVKVTVDCGHPIQHGGLRTEVEISMRHDYLDAYEGAPFDEHGWEISELSRRKSQWRLRRDRRRAAQERGVDPSEVAAEFYFTARRPGMVAGSWFPPAGEMIVETRTRRVRWLRAGESISGGEVSHDYRKDHRDHLPGIDFYINGRWCDSRRRCAARAGDTVVVAMETWRKPGTQSIAVSISPSLDGGSPATTAAVRKGVTSSFDVDAACNPLDDGFALADGRYPRAEYQIPDLHPLKSYFVLVEGQICLGEDDKQEFSEPIRVHAPADPYPVLRLLPTLSMELEPEGLALTPGAALYGGVGWAWNTKLANAIAPRSIGAWFSPGPLTFGSAPSEVSSWYLGAGTTIAGGVLFLGGGLDLAQAFAGSSGGGPGFVTSIGVGLPHPLH